MSQLACQLKSLHATYITGDLIYVANSLSQEFLWGEWTLDGPADYDSMRSGADRSVYLTYCLLWYSHTQTYCLTAGPRAYTYAFSPSEPHCTDPVQSQRGQGTDLFCGTVLAQQDMVLRAMMLQVSGIPRVTPSVFFSVHTCKNPHFIYLHSMIISMSGLL